MEIARTFLFESKIALKHWKEKFSHAKWLCSRLSSLWINLKISHKFWSNRCPDYFSVPQFGRLSYEFLYGAPNFVAKEFVLHIVFDYLVGTPSDNTHYQICPQAVKLFSFAKKEILQRWGMILSYHRFLHYWMAQKEIELLKNLQKTKTLKQVFRLQYSLTLQTQTII